MLGLLGLYFEFANPGAIFPGVIGGISLLLAFLSFQILPVNYVGLLLILLGRSFYSGNKVTSYGALAVGGVVSLFLGSVILIKAPIPELRPSLKFIIPVVLGISLIFVMLVYLVIKAHARRSLTGKEGMIGELGQALSPFSPDGKFLSMGKSGGQCLMTRLTKEIKSRW